MSNNIIKKASDILNKFETPDRHSFFQIEKFIIGKEVTAQAQLWSIIRELQSRKETVENLELDLENAEDNLELFDIKVEKIDKLIRMDVEKDDVFSQLNIRENEINIRKLQREKHQLIESSRKVQKKLKGVFEEMEFLLKCYDNIIENFEDVKNIDDEESQKEMWNEKLLEEFNLRIILNRPLDPDFIRTIMCLPEDSPVKKQTTALINKIQGNMITTMVK